MPVAGAFDLSRGLTHRVTPRFHASAERTSQSVGGLLLLCGLCRLLLLLRFLFGFSSLVSARYYPAGGADGCALTGIPGNSSYGCSRSRPARGAASSGSAGLLLLTGTTLRSGRRRLAGS